MSVLNISIGKMSRCPWDYWTISTHQSSGLSEIPSGHGDGADVEGRVADDPQAFRVLQDEGGTLALDVGVHERLRKLNHSSIDRHL